MVDAILHRRCCYDPPPPPPPPQYQWQRQSVKYEEVDEGYAPAIAQMLARERASRSLQWRNAGAGLFVCTIDCSHYLPATSMLGRAAPIQRPPGCNSIHHELAASLQGPKLYCLRQVHLAENQPRELHTKVTSRSIGIISDHTKKEKTHKYGLKYALHSLDGHFEWSPYQKISFGNFDFELPRVTNCISRLCTYSLGDPPPPQPKKTHKYCLKHALHSLDGHCEGL